MNNENEFSGLIEFVKDAYLVIEPFDNQVITANAATIELLGYELRELQSLTVTSLFSDDVPALVAFTQCVLADKEGWTNELSCKMKNTRLLEVEISANAIFLNNRQYLVFQLRDKNKYMTLQNDADAHAYVRSGLTEWKRIEQIFEDLERENQLLLQAVGEGIYGVNADGKTTFINPAGEKILGWQASELVGKDIHSLIHHTREGGDHFPSHDCPIYAAFHDGEIHQVSDDVFWHKNGKPIYVDYTSTPLEDNGKLVGAVVVFRDISDRRQANEKLRNALHEVEELKRRLEMENAYLQEEIREETSYTEIVGNSEAIKRSIYQIELVAQTDANVLITGESGTGKELIARAIHENSLRKSRPVIRVNCAAIPHELFESEFFGHVKGAFTGAFSDRTGRFELADGGTLFLDEVGEIPIELQSKLLRVIQDGQFERVGENKTRQVDVRIIAATNRNLIDEVTAKRFREDLYFRLNVFPIQSTPLRERLEDIPLLAVHFLKHCEKRLNKSGLRLSIGDIEQLQQYNWQGNIRELENVIERAVILSKDGRLRFELPGNEQTTVESPDKEIHYSIPADKKIKTAKEITQQEIINIRNALQQCRGKVFGDDGAAAIMNMPPTTLASKIKRHGINRLDYRQ